MAFPMNFNAQSPYNVQYQALQYYAGVGQNMSNNQLQMFSPQFMAQWYQQQNVHLMNMLNQQRIPMQPFQSMVQPFVNPAALHGFNPGNYGSSGWAQSGAVPQNYGYAQDSGYAQQPAQEQPLEKYGMADMAGGVVEAGANIIGNGLIGKGLAMAANFIPVVGPFIAAILGGTGMLGKVAKFLGLDKVMNFVEKIPVVGSVVKGAKAVVGAVAKGVGGVVKGVAKGIGSVVKGIGKIFKGW